MSVCFKVEGPRKCDSPVTETRLGRDGALCPEGVVVENCVKEAVEDRRRLSAIDCTNAVRARG